jgi:hypothetical protein
MAITKDMTVARVFEKNPSLQPVFQSFGFGALMNPLLRASFGRMTSIERGCRIHGVDLNKFLEALNGALENPSPAVVPAAPPSSAAEDPEVASLLSRKTSDLIAAHPATRAVFVKYFGDGCFSCPSFGQEDVRFACSMHGADPTVFSRECLALMRPRRFTGEELVRDLLARHREAFAVLHRFAVDGCCGGAHPLKTAAQAHGVKLDDILAALEAAVP